MTVLKYRGVKTIICDTEYVKEKYGILPEQYVDFKSLTGDSSDNIKGVEKVGIKTAAQLINQFNTLNNLINNTHAISKLHIDFFQLICNTVNEL